MERKKKKKSRRSSLTLYLDRVAEGDESYKTKLCRNLSDRLLYVPLDPSDQVKSDGADASVTIKVLKIKHDGNKVVPVFSTESLFEKWSSERQDKLESVILAGADLCKVLPPGMWLLVDRGGESEVVLDSLAVDAISEFGDKALEDEFGSDKIVELKETDIVQLEVPLEASSQVSSTDVPKESVSDPEVATVVAPDENEEPSKGLRGWLNV